MTDEGVLRADGDRGALELVDLDRLAEAAGDCVVVDHLGRRCVRFGEGYRRVVVPGVELLDGIIEADLVVPPERSFHGLAWRVAGNDAETFFVRPHQVGNPDAVQYTPEPNGVSSWQLYHGPDSWSPLDFPIGTWFTIRVAFTADRAEVFVGDDTSPVLSTRLRLPPRSGGLGVLVGGPSLHLGRLSIGRGRAHLRGGPPGDEPPRRGTIAAWEVSDAFPEAEVASRSELPPAFVAARSWTALAAEPGGLANLAFVNGLAEDRDTVLARATIRSDAARLTRLELGFSDRATVFLNGRAVFSADDAYRRRDHRFLGSIGYWYTLHLPLLDGSNELVVAVTEEFGGWGVQARVVGDT